MQVKKHEPEKKKKKKKKKTRDPPSNVHWTLLSALNNKIKGSTQQSN